MYSNYCSLSFMRHPSTLTICLLTLSRTRTILNIQMQSPGLRCTQVGTPPHLLLHSQSHNEREEASKQATPSTKLHPIATEGFKSSPDIVEETSPLSLSLVSFKMFLKFVFKHLLLFTVINFSDSLPRAESDLPTDAEWFLDQPEFNNFLQTLPSSRSGRTLLEPEQELPECGGRFMTLNPGDSTVIKSHKSYGLTPYPSDYLVSPGLD